MLLNVRLKEIIKHSGKNVTAFGNEFSSTSAENIRKLIKNPNANPTFNFIVELLQKYPEINQRWLLLGEGEMVVATPVIGQIPKTNQNELERLREKIEDQRKTIAAQEELLEVYRGKREKPVTNRE